MFMTSLKYLERDDLNEVISVHSANFSIEISPEKDQIFRVSVGAFETCTGEQGTFLLYLTPDILGQYKFSHMEVLSTEATFVLLYPVNNREFEVWWCLDCDGLSKYEWNTKEANFYYHEQEEI